MLTHIVELPLQERTESKPDQPRCLFLPLRPHRRSKLTCTDSGILGSYSGNVHLSELSKEVVMLSDPSFQSPFALMRIPSGERLLWISFAWVWRNESPWAICRIPFWIWERAIIEE